MQTPQVQIGAAQSPAGKGLAASQKPEAGGASFQALLEKLEKHVDGLAGRSLEEPGQLSGVVDEARASLDAALDLGRDLIEAYREAHVSG